MKTSSAAAFSVASGSATVSGVFAVLITLQDDFQSSTIKNMKTIIMKMSDAYDYMDFYQKLSDCHILDFSQLEGTRCYLDDAAQAHIEEAIAPFNGQELHFIDSGNYHYLSLLWLKKINQDFNLVLFDHHPDNQPPSFGQIISCGGWVLDASDSLPHLKGVYSYGVGQEVLPQDIPKDLPVYISIDKDVLSQDFAITDWDQGDMSLDAMLDLLKIIFDNHKILGIDICGESSEYALDGAKVNSQTNTRLLYFLRENL